MERAAKEWPLPILTTVLLPVPRVRLRLRFRPPAAAATAFTSAATAAAATASAAGAAVAGSLDGISVLPSHPGRPRDTKGTQKRLPSLVFTGEPRQPCSGKLGRVVLLERP